MNTCDIITVNLEEQAWHSLLADYAVLVLDRLALVDWEISVTLCDDEYIRKLNAEFRNKDEATDVLSFPQHESVAEHFIAGGDIVISLHSVRANAQYFNVAVEEELRRVLVHGILHLNGMDHKTIDPGEPMLVLQEKILAEKKDIRFPV